ncbi:transposase [Facklamia sp. P9177]|uniref:transposase n=1 Tax=Facklamia sp. P9177 TaxID=3421945 RepID=UPI003D1757F0
MNEGKRETVGFMIQNEENNDTCSFLKQLKEGGLQRTEFVISDDYKDIVVAIRQLVTKASWQRHQINFLRNIFVIISKKTSNFFVESWKNNF